MDSMAEGREGARAGASTETKANRLRRYIDIKLAASGHLVVGAGGDSEFLEEAGELLALYREKSRLLAYYLCPVDYRIQQFLRDYLQDCSLPQPLQLPTNTLLLDRKGVARELSLPAQGDHFHSAYVESYRVRQGVLHNTCNDRRTTEGSYHIAEGGLPIPGDKLAVPKQTFALLLHHALHPPIELMQLPYTSQQTQQVGLFVSLLLRPVVCPEIPGFQPEKNMETRFFAPGGLVANLDFVESIFGNGGNPYLSEHDAGLDAKHWTGHTGCVFLAPHLTELTKREVGLPHVSEASERQRKEGMCWAREDELYNQGKPFKITARTQQGAIVTILGDNYFGYCKKEVKAQLSFAANLYGLAEEEHAGGALVFPSYNLGEQFYADSRVRTDGHCFADVVQLYAESFDLQPEGHGVDKAFPDLLYVPEDAFFDVTQQRVSWMFRSQERSIRLQPGKIYIHPSGYKVRLEKHPGAPTWRLIGTEAEGIFCHKPCTVSGGGKSEISKSLNDAILYGPIFVNDLQRDLDWVEEIFQRDYSDRFLPEFQVGRNKDDRRAVLSPQRTLGSVIKLLTPSPGEFTPEYNGWLESIPSHIRALVFVIKRLYVPEWGDRWRAQFNVDIVNGSPGHEVKFGDRKLVGSYLRVGFDHKNAWRTYKLRQDFIAAEKLQMEDDISVSVLFDAARLPNLPEHNSFPCVKLVQNCELRLFQRPDDAIHRGFDKQTERDMAEDDNFLANFEALTPAQVREEVDNAIIFDKYSAPMKQFLKRAASEASGYAVSSALSRIVQGKPSKNPRYLQLRPDLANPLKTYLAHLGTRMHRRLPLSQSICFPVDAVLMGRRNNPPEPAFGIRPLAVYNPIHYQELPELFMDLICSITGKSPSTTGAGSEGALTKGPFNALRATSDLNGALVSYILSGYGGFSSAARYIGPKHRVDHDISLLIPEIWSRLTEQERSPAFLIEHGYLEPLEDFEHKGKSVLASRLGYRITSRFVHAFLGKIFDDPAVVFDRSLLCPEEQDLEVFVDGVHNIVEAQQRAAQQYLDDGGLSDVCPPLQVLLQIMAEGHYQGKDVHHPQIRQMFSRESMLCSDWYQARLKCQQQRSIDLWQRHIHYLEEFLTRESHVGEAQRLGIPARLHYAQQQLKQAQAPDYIEQLHGTIGADPLQPIHSPLPL